MLSTRQIANSVGVSEGAIHAAIRAGKLREPPRVGRSYIWNTAAVEDVRRVLRPSPSTSAAN